MTLKDTLQLRDASGRRIPDPPNPASTMKIPGVGSLKVFESPELFQTSFGEATAVGNDGPRAHHQGPNRAYGKRRR